MHLCTLVFIYSYIAFYIHISLYHLYIIFFMRFYQDLAIHVLSIFLSCMLLLIHIFISYTLIFIYFPIHASTDRCFYTVFHITIPYYLLCHVFTIPIIHVHVLILVLCHLLLFSIVLSIYAFLSFVLSMFHLIPFGMSIIYSYHLRIPIMSIIYFLSCFIYSFMYDNHMFTTYNLIFICAYHLCTLDYHIL